MSSSTRTAPSHAEVKQRARLESMAAAKKQLAAVDETTLAASGLSSGQVAERLALDLGNAVPNDSSRTIGQILRANLLTLFNIVLGICLVIVLLVGKWQDALFGFIVIANAAIGVVQEYRAKRTLDRLAVLNAPKARALRDGVVQDIQVEHVVYDDVLVLRTGDQVPADAEVLSVAGLEIDESLLTGESDPIDKSPGDEVLSGSAVVSGSGTVRVQRVGIESFASKLTAEAKRFSLVNSEIRNSINKIVLYITWALVPIIILVINGQMQAKGGWGVALGNGDWKEAVVSAVASIVAMIPEGLVLLTSISFGLAAMTLARRQVLVQELPAVEGLARVDMVCLDKTGTLTEGEIVFDAEQQLNDVPGWRAALAWIGADDNANATAACLAVEYHTGPTKPALSSVPFNSARKWSAVCFEAEGTAGAGVSTWVFGAPKWSSMPEPRSTGQPWRRPAAWRKKACVL